MLEGEVLTSHKFISFPFPSFPFPSFLFLPLSLFLPFRPCVGVWQDPAESSNGLCASEVEAPFVPLLDSAHVAQCDPRVSSTPRSRADHQPRCRPRHHALLGRRTPRALVGALNVRSCRCGATARANLTLEALVRAPSPLDIFDLHTSCRSSGAFARFVNGEPRCSRSGSLSPCWTSAALPFFPLAPLWCNWSHIATATSV